MRLVSLSPAVSSVLVALGAAEQIVGVDRWSTRIPELAERPSLGGLFGPDLERLMELRPSLVLGVRSAQQHGFFERLRSRGVGCAQIESGGDLEQVLATYRQLGDLVGRRPQAERLVAQVRRDLDALAGSVAGRPRLRVALLLDVEPLYVAGRGSFVHTLIEAAGGENAFGDLPEPYPRVSLEVLAERAPQVLLDTSVEPGDTGAQLAARSRWAHHGWAGRVVFVPRGLATLPGAQLAEGARLIRDGLHPDLAADPRP